MIPTIIFIIYIIISFIGSSLMYRFIEKDELTVFVWAISWPILIVGFPFVFLWKKVAGVKKEE